MLAKPARVVFSDLIWNLGSFSTYTSMVPVRLRARALGMIRCCRLARKHDTINCNVARVHRAEEAANHLIRYHDWRVQVTTCSFTQAHMAHARLATGIRVSHFEHSIVKKFVFWCRQGPGMHNDNITNAGLVMTKRHQRDTPAYNVRTWVSVLNTFGRACNHHIDIALERWAMGVATVDTGKCVYHESYM